MDQIKVCIAGATGWAGSALSKGVFHHGGMQLTAAVSRQNEGRNLADVLDLVNANIPVFGSVADSLSVDYDVMVEYTKPDVARNNIMSAVSKGISVVVGTSGLTDEDYHVIEKAAIKNGCSVLAVGNFAITAVLMMKFSQIAAKYIPNYEIIDYAHESKIDAPSGTARELASQLSKVRPSKVYVSDKDVVGSKESRGARLNEVQVHSVRLPGYVISIESLFGQKDERLTIRHDAGSGSEPYVQGALLAIEKVRSFKGLKRGLDAVMDF